MELNGDLFFEVYNGHPQVENAGDAHHLSMDALWDAVLTRRIAELKLEPMFGVAVDDSHNYHTSDPTKSRPGLGWIMVRARHLTAESIIRALEAGDFYATSGVVLSEVARSGNRLSLSIQADPPASPTAPSSSAPAGTIPRAASSSPLRSIRLRRVAPCPIAAIPRRSAPCSPKAPAPPRATPCAATSFTCGPRSSPRNPNVTAAHPASGKPPGPSRCWPHGPDRLKPADTRRVRRAMKCRDMAPKNGLATDSSRSSEQAGDCSAPFPFMNRGTATGWATTRKLTTTLSSSHRMRSCWLVILLLLLARGRGRADRRPLAV